METYFDRSLDLAVTPFLPLWGHFRMVGSVTFRAQAVLNLRRNAEDRGSWVRLNSDSGTEELPPPSLLIGRS